MMLTKFRLMFLSAIILLILILSIFFYQPRWLLKIIVKVAPGVYYFSETTDKIVAVTIDDGPNTITTPKMLETLSKNDTKATFFIISERLDKNEEIVENIINNGHEIGNHLVKDEKSIFLSKEEFEDKFLTADKSLNQFLLYESSKVT